jgi:hypothetical protein
VPGYAAVVQLATSRWRSHIRSQLGGCNRRIRVLPKTPIDRSDGQWTKFITKLAIEGYFCITLNAARSDDVPAPTKAKRVGRPKLPKDEAKGKIVPVRFEPEDLKLVTAAAKAGNQTLSAWIRQTLRRSAEMQMFKGTLHDAIRIVLFDQAAHTATTSQICAEIERRGLYTRKDGEAARAKQINARVRQYPDLFTFDKPGTVRLLAGGAA